MIGLTYGKTYRLTTGKLLMEARFSAWSIFFSFGSKEEREEKKKKKRKKMNRVERSRNRCKLFIDLRWKVKFKIVHGSS